jgi:hypothetical protein
MGQNTLQVIDLGPELLVDRTSVASPQLKLMLAAIGEQIAPGSAWVALDKRVAAVYPQLLRLLDPRHNRTLAA